MSKGITIWVDDGGTSQIEKELYEKKPNHCDGHDKPKRMERLEKRPRKT